MWNSHGVDSKSRVRLTYSTPTRVNMLTSLLVRRIRADAFDRETGRKERSHRASIKIIQTVDSDTMFELFDLALTSAVAAC